MWDTGMGAGRTITAAFLALMACSGSAAAEPTPLRAKVVWAHAGRVYIASADSLPLEEGDLLTFQAERKVLASASVSAIHDGTLAIARVESGSLDRVKKLDRLRVFAERRPIRPAPVFRVGLPARSNLLFACDAVTLRMPFPAAAYRGDTLSERSFRFVRDPSSVDSGPWPDTLLIRLYDDSTDEEIAIERGELDVAVFWPGELSTHVRENPQWRDFQHGIVSRGVLTALAPGSEEITVADSAAMSSLNDEVFRGDLGPLPFPPVPRGGTPRRFEVDRSLPGWQTIERFLNRGNETRAMPGNPDPVRVKFSDGPVGTGVDHTPAIAFSVRCPVVCAPNLRPYVRALGPDALADMLDCRPARRGP